MKRVVTGSNVHFQSSATNGVTYTKKRKKMTENIKGPFYSNCLVEAIKQKIKHPIKTKITVVRKSEAGCPHFLWSDGKFDYDFGTDRWLDGFERAWFEGYIHRRALGYNERYKRRMEKRWRGEQDGN